jgi:hypothetical protein
MALSDEEIFDAIFYIQGFSVADDYNSKWAPLSRTHLPAA